MTTAIIGAAGAIGKSVLNASRERGHKVRLVGRNRAALEALCPIGCNVAKDEIVIADMASVEGCSAALRDVTTAVYALGLPYSAKAFSAYPVMMRHFVEAARSAGVRRAVLIANVYPYGLAQSNPVTESHPRNPCSIKGKYRKEQEDIFLGAGDKDFETITLCLPDFYGPQAQNSLLAMAVNAARAGKPAMLLAPADTPHEFVFTPDVGPVVLDLLQLSKPLQGAFHFGGAGVITQRELAAMMFKAAGHAPHFRVMPVWLQKLMGLVMPLMRELDEMRYLHEQPVFLDDSKLRMVLPNIRKTPYAEGAKACVL